MALSIQRLGDRAILVTLGTRVDPKINDQVIALHQRLVNADGAEIDFFTPAFCSLGIGYDPAVLSYDALCELVRQEFERIKTVGEHERKLVRIPVCYSPDLGIDLEHVAASTGITLEQVVQLHTGKTYRAYMLGFLPGFAYLGSVDQRLRVDRHAQPRVKVAAGSVGLAGQQTGVYPCEAPGGWQIIGRTPVSLHGPSPGDSPSPGDTENPFLVSPGDEVQFYQIDQAEFDALSAQNNCEHADTQTALTIHTADSVSLHFKTAGLRTAVQDFGRTGYQHLGVPSGGVMDRFSATIANRLVGNADDAALIEITLMGPTIEITGDCQIAITGADLSPMLDGQAVAMWETIPVTSTHQLRFGSRQNGCRCYLAIAGEFQVASWLESVSVSPSGADSATAYQSLKDKTMSVIANPAPTNKRIFPEGQRPVQLVRANDGPIETRIHFLPGPEWDWFSAEQRSDFFSHRFEILPNSNSMGYRLSSFLSQPLDSPAMISSAVVPGAIQVTPSGQCILLMRDAQSTGGYPRMGVALYDSLNEVAQLRPGDSIRFELK